MERLLAILDVLEDTTWVDAFTYAKNELHYSDRRADEYAWKQTQEHFPRLREFDGCQP